MKTALAYFFSMLMILFFGSVFLVSCKSKQPLTDKIVEKTVNSDSIYQSKVITRNQAINDSLKIIIGQVRTEKKECDSVCQIAIERVLSQLNTKKTSGSNSYGVFYDSKDKSLNLNTAIGATKNDSIYIIKKYNYTKTIYSHRYIPVEKPFNRWHLFLMVTGAGTLGYLLLKIILFIKARIPA